jgi:anhydro-N-acetylmuramic acid kinase
MTKTLYHVLGLMSGTSLDGLDLAFCRFGYTEEKWKYKILLAETIPYSNDWKNRIQHLDKQSAGDFAFTDSELGHLMGRMAKEFIDKHHINPDFIASHGQTIFHSPGKRWTTQIGKGAAIAAETNIPVVCDFRSTDVALGGQGAPLVPIGDRFLFPGFTYCLNLGGFANLSFERNGTRIACDICPANMVLNTLAGQVGKAFDENGDLARSGSLIPDLLKTLNQLPFYHQPPPKSLGKEWVDEYIRPLILNVSGHEAPAMRHKPYGIRHHCHCEERSDAATGSRIQDLLHTFTEHIAMQVGNNTGINRVDNLLITGGGALNTYLVERIRHYATPDVILPDLQTIQFKEALIFALLGLLRWRGEVNCLASVTGASRNSSSGAIYLP